MAMLIIVPINVH